MNCQSNGEKVCAFSKATFAARRFAPLVFSCLVVPSFTNPKLAACNTVFRGLADLRVIVMPDFSDRVERLRFMLEFPVGPSGSPSKKLCLLNDSNKSFCGNVHR
jgi:predicted small secreted protein